jgi:biotin carboxyl carrier protein
VKQSEFVSANCQKRIRSPEAGRQEKEASMTLFAPVTLPDIVPIEIHAVDSIDASLSAKQAGAVRRSASPLRTVSATAITLLVGAVSLAFVTLATSAAAQTLPSGPPPVGVVTVQRQPMTDSYEFNGRIQATNSVNIVPRVSAFLEQQLFAEGTDVKKGDLLYVLERPPYQAAVDVQKAAIAQAQAQLDNDKTELWRKQQLVEKSAGTQQAVDTAEATQRSRAAQVQAAQAQLEIAQINFDYTEIRSPIDGRIGRSSVTVGNVLGPNSGVLTTVVSQDPMYVLFPVPTRRAIELREEYAENGGFDAVKVRLRLPDGRRGGSEHEPHDANATRIYCWPRFDHRFFLARSETRVRTAGGEIARQPGGEPHARRLDPHQRGW